MLKPSIIVHATIPNCFYCSPAKKFTQDIRRATRYDTDEARGAGVQEIKDNFPKFRYGMVMMLYLTM